jgi:CspA family cold shock protein
METGKIKKLIDRGFGFIAASDETEVFFHRSDCQSVEFDSLSEGQEVTFERESGAKGPRARNVRPKIST